MKKKKIKNISSSVNDYYNFLRGNREFDIFSYRVRITPAVITHESNRFIPNRNVR